MKHIPVLLNEVIEFLAVQSGEKYIDATFGMGGHSREITKAGGEVLGIDRDPSVFKTTNKDWLVVAGSFGDMLEIATENGFDKVSGILFDLGIGSHQLDDKKRGFSFQSGSSLNMKYDASSRGVSADYIVNEYDEKDLAKIFRTLGEEKFANRIARKILQTRKSKSIDTTTELFEIIKQAIPGKFRHRAGDSARRVFQSLRIAVNDELSEIEMALPQAVQLLKPGGRLVVISFHSLEDRIVKRFMVDQAKECVCPSELPVCRCDKVATLKILTPKPVTASQEEATSNKRSKSAKLRAAERL